MRIDELHDRGGPVFSFEFFPPKTDDGARTFAQAGAAAAYCGDPARASAAEGRDLIERLATMTVESIREAWPELFA